MTRKLTDEEAAVTFIWLANTAGTELLQLAGGAPQAPDFNELTVDYLDRIGDAVADLKRYVKKAEKEEPEPEPEKTPEPVKKAEATEAKPKGSH